MVSQIQVPQDAKDTWGTQKAKESAYWGLFWGHICYFRCVCKVLKVGTLPQC